MKKLLFIGSSKIVEEHIKSALKVGFKLYSIISTRKNSINQKRLIKKYKFQKQFRNWKTALDFVKNDKNIILFIAPRIKDNVKILKNAIKGKNFIIIEKPLSSKLEVLSFFNKYKKRIFITYNRIFYENVLFLKKNLNKPSSIVVKFTDSSKKKIMINSIHIVFIIQFLFGELKIIYKKHSKNSVHILAKNKNDIPIFFIFNTKYPETFSIDIRDVGSRYFLKPLEKMKIFTGIRFNYKSKNKKMLIPTEKLYKKFDLYKSNNLKPGFLNQMKFLKKNLSKNKNVGNLDFGFQVVKFTRNFLN